MSWISTIDYDQSEGPLRKIYDRVKGPDNNVDNVLLIHSLRPHTLTGHMTLYKSVLHNSKNTLPKWYLEALGVYVSYLNECDYCVQHHFAGFKRLIQDEERADKFMNCIRKDTLGDFFERSFFLGSEYARDITLSPWDIVASQISELRESGLSEGEILEINQVSSYFNYVNRMVVALGVTSEGDIIGLSPNDSDNPKNWEHQ